MRLSERATGAASQAGAEPVEALAEVDRYIAIPGQALAYKVGQREIERLRRVLVGASSGAELRRFHDELLGHGSLPLGVLAAHLPRWLASPA